MKCPKCSLVTFDHLSKCPRCKQTFDLSRRLTRRRTNPHRRIVLRSTAADESVPRDAARPPAPDETPTAPVETADLTAASTAPQLAAEPGVGESPDFVPARSPSEAGSPSPEISGDAEGPAVPSLQAMAELERADDVSVNVSDAVKAVRDSVRQEPAPTATPEPSVPAEAAPESPASASDDSKTIKERMVRASRARRKQRPDLVTEAIDPVLPDWYEPDLDESDGASRSEGKSVSRG